MSERDTTSKIVKKAFDRSSFSSIREFSRFSKVTATTISEWFRDIRIPGDINARKIAKTLDIPFNEEFIEQLDMDRFRLKHIRYIDRHEDDLDKMEDMVSASGVPHHGGYFHEAAVASVREDYFRGILEDVVWVPILGTVPAGEPVEVTPAAAQDAEGFVPTAKADIPNPEHVFALRARGDSMTGYFIQEGDTIVIDASREARTGDAVMAIIDGKITLRRYREQKGIVILEGANTSIDPVILTDENGENPRIVGVMIQHIKHTE